MRVLLLRPLCTATSAAACSEESPEASIASLPCRHRVQVCYSVLLNAMSMYMHVAQVATCMSSSPATCILLRHFTCMLLRHFTRILLRHFACMSRSPVTCICRQNQATPVYQPIQHMHQTRTRLHTGNCIVPPSSSADLKYTHAMTTVKNANCWITWPIPSKDSIGHQTGQRCCLCHPALFSKCYADKNICIVYTARRAHLCAEDSAIFLCICSVFIRLPWQIALV